MKRLLLIVLGLLLIVGSIFTYQQFITPNQPISGAPPYYIEDTQPPADLNNRYSYLKDWKRPEGPAKVGLQVGHWKANEAPDELHRLRTNTGASGGGKYEWEVNYAIALQTAEILKQEGIEVEILPTTVPPGYWADVFISIHADGSEDSSKVGFKAATPRRDRTEKANELLTFVENEYQKATKLSKDPNVTRNMKGYYAFSYWRYTHAVHPHTTSLILETGFLTSPVDRKVIVSQPQLPAQGLALGIINFLKSENLLSS